MYWYMTKVRRSSLTLETKILQHIRESGLQLKLSKYVFFKRYLHYLGNLISGEVVYLLKQKVSLLIHLALPNDVAQMRHIIGLALYYRTFIANVSDIMGLLTALTN